MLPTTSPTIMQPAADASDVPPAPPPMPVHRAQVSYQMGHLTVIADNSSLNQILHDICRQTGMTITGGVVDEPVFGAYGPGAPAEIIARLLQGTGTNMMLRQTADNVPAELVLTPTQGSPTPPSPSMQRGDDDAPPTQISGHAPAGMDRPLQPRPYVAQPRPSRPDYVPTLPLNEAQPAGAQPAPGNPQSPNGVATPEQIYQQLQQLRQQQAQPPAPPR
jgi:hypothetical protein